MLKIHGVPFSAHTRKIILLALEKGLAYELIQTIPLKPPPGWAELSPLGLIPVLQTEHISLADSSVIGLYLEKKFPQRPCYPALPEQYGRALWIEEYVDSALAPHVLTGLLLERVFAPMFLNRPCDDARVRESIERRIPPALAYLDAQFAGPWFVGERFTIADVTVLSILLNYHYAGESLDAACYPALSAFLEQSLARDSVRQALRIERLAAQQVPTLDLSILDRAGL